MTLDWNAVLSHLTPSSAATAALGALVGAYGRPLLAKAARALPDYLVRRAKEKFYADVRAGKISPLVAKLAVKLKRAVFEWANEELPEHVGPEKMAQAILALEKLPYIGRLVAADPDGVAEDLENEYEAWKAEIAAEAKLAAGKQALSDRALPNP